MTLDPLDPPVAAGSEHLRWGALAPGLDALVLAGLARSHRGTTLVVTADSGSAERFEQEIAFFLGGESAARSVVRLPDWETLPYDRFSPHQDLVSERLRSLARLAEGERLLLLVPVATLMQRLPPVGYVAAGSLSLAPGMALTPEALRTRLSRAGYRHADNVCEHGEFALRGAILDVFPMGLEEPVRVEFFDDEIETLRHFDPDTQRSTGTLPTLDLLPGREFPFHEEAISAFRRRWHARFEADHRHCPDYQDVLRGIAPGGIEYWLPLFFESCATLFDYLPEGTLACLAEGAAAELERSWQVLGERYASLGADHTRPLLAPREICLPPDELRAALKTFPRLDFGPSPAPERAGATDFDGTPLATLGLADLPDAMTRITRLLAMPDMRLLFCAESAGRREMLSELLRRAGAAIAPAQGWEDFLTSDSSPMLTVAPLEQGFLHPARGIAVVPESALFGRRVLQRRRRSRGADGWESGIRDLAELAVGVPVVHLELGVGRYLGLQALEVDGERAEFLCIAYAEDAKLFVPVTSLSLVSRYTGVDGESVQLARLGS
ncbi:MAG: CarD family transcriptional regulator, partial [Gammaproteobacteria bacterium]